MAWVYRREGKDIGPVSTAQLFALVEAGTVSPETDVRDMLSEKWMPAKTIDGLFSKASEQSLKSPKREERPTNFAADAMSEEAAYTGSRGPVGKDSRGPKPQRSSRTNVGKKYPSLLATSGIYETLARMTFLVGLGSVIGIAVLAAELPTAACIVVLLVGIPLLIVYIWVAVTTLQAIAEGIKLAVDCEEHLRTIARNTDGQNR